MKRFHRYKRRACVDSRYLRLPLLILLLLGSGLAQAPSAPQNLPAPSDVIQFLSKTIYWYQQTQLEQQLVTEPGDLAFADNNQRMAEQIVRLAFESARQTAQLIEKQSKANPAAVQTNNLSTYNGLTQAAVRADQQLQQTQAELQSLEQKRDAAFGKKRQQLDSQVEELKSELGLVQARTTALRSMTSFLSGASSGKLGATGLQGQIEELAHSVPSYLSEPQEKNATGPAENPSLAAKTAAATKQPPSGIWGLAADIFHLSVKTRTLKQEIVSADNLLQTTNQLRTPLVANLKQLIQSGNQLSVQADNSDTAALAQEKSQLDTLTAQFKSVSATAIPLDQQAIMLDLYKRSLLNWQQTVSSKYVVDIKSLIFRLAFLAVLVAIVLGLGEIWKRTIFRYVQDIRRRYQLLLLRRIALWIVIALVLVFTFASELGSIATFAGLITAGVAVALQNVILAIVGYFFLIGKYGIRVGDRVQVAGVTGSVIDIGMVRFHLMELESGSTDSQPTGRVVAFSNSIVFQATPGLFKQIPGTSFIWHQIKLTFDAESDHHMVRERISKAIDTALADYKEPLARQREQMERNLAAVPATELNAKTRMHFTPAGLELLVHYPVVLQKAQEIDDKLMSAVITEVGKEPKLKLIASELPGRVAA